MLLASARPAAAGDDAALAQELTNPVADLITLPVQMNLDRGIGPIDEGTRLTTNVQPVVPFGLGEDWTLITRTILPVIYQHDVALRSGSRFGLGDLSASLFLSPKRPLAGLIVGLGPIFLLPTATDSRMGTEKWGLGPSAVVLALRGRWTAGLLANHVWSYAGDSDRRSLSNTFLQPFVAYTWPSAWTVSLQSETSYAWKASTWGVPVNLAVAKLVRIGRLPVSLMGGVGYWARSAGGGADGFRYRLQVNLVLPR